jgi:hypothetical protein
MTLSAEEVKNTGRFADIANFTPEIKRTVHRSCVYSSFKNWTSVQPSCMGYMGWFPRNIVTGLLEEELPCPL